MFDGIFRGFATKSEKFSLGDGGLQNSHVVYESAVPSLALYQFLGLLTVPQWRQGVSFGSCGDVLFVCRIEATHSFKFSHRYGK